MNQVLSALRLALGVLVMATSVAVQMLVLLVLLPSRNLRIRSCNYWGKVVGRALMAVSGSTVHVDGWEHLDARRPAIYISNHASVFDAFLAMFLSPVGTCGVVKKEIVYYPFFGQMYLLSGHLRIDRGDRDKAIASLAGLASDVKRFGLSIFVWPEGTRSKSGRLGVFKKGVVHMALATGLPIVPVVVAGAHRGWQKGSMVLHPTLVTVRVLPPIDTSRWSRDTAEEHLDAVWRAVRDALPEEQRPEAAAKHVAA